MAHRLLITITALALAAAAVLGGTDVAAAQSGGTQSHSAVQATAASEYVFATPADAVFRSGKGQYHIGLFQVGSLFLRDSERLRLDVTASPLTKVDSDVSIPFQVWFEDPGQFDSASSGESFPVGIRIDPFAFVKGGAGTYRGSITFEVTSDYDDTVVWSDAFEVVFNHMTPVITPVTRPSSYVSSPMSGRGTKDAANSADGEEPDVAEEPDDTASEPVQPPAQSEEPGDSTERDDDHGTSGPVGWLRDILVGSSGLCCIPPLILLLVVWLLARRRQAAKATSSPPSETPPSGE